LQPKHDYALKKRALILGVHSFIDSNPKVGIQYIAEGLADSGWQVDYASIFSSPFDFYGVQRRSRLKRVWRNRQDKYGITIKPGLTEYAFRAPFPAHRHILCFTWQLKMFAAFKPYRLLNQVYDICIHDITANILYLEMIKPQITILRLNDLPEGFSHSLSKHVINRLIHYISTNHYREIWSAHEPLTQYALKLNSVNRAFTIRNGVDDSYLNMPMTIQRKTKSAVYIGSIERWVDLELIQKTASILQDWQFDIIGPLRRSWPITAKNVKWLQPISKHNVLNVLAGYRVGLIPFREVSGRLAYVERPLKFLEYIGAGLGVACTDVGALKSGIGALATFGNSPDSFADAIRREAIRSDYRSRERCLEMIKPYAWSSITKTILYRLENLGIGATA
jgi:hypothetical protein